MIACHHPLDVVSPSSSHGEVRVWDSKQAECMIIEMDNEDHEPFGDVPVECFKLVCSYLRLREVVVVSGVCWKAYRATSSDDIWRVFFNENFSNTSYIPFSDLILDDLDQATHATLPPMQLPILSRTTLPDSCFKSAYKTEWMYLYEKVGKKELLLQRRKAREEKILGVLSFMKSLTMLTWPIYILFVLLAITIGLFASVLHVHNGNSAPWGVAALCGKVVACNTWILGFLVISRMVHIGMGGPAPETKMLKYVSLITVAWCVTVTLGVIKLEGSPLPWYTIVFPVSFSKLVIVTDAFREFSRLVISKIRGGTHMIAGIRQSLFGLALVGLTSPVWLTLQLITISIEDSRVITCHQAFALTYSLFAVFGSIGIGLVGHTIWKAVWGTTSETLLDWIVSVWYCAACIVYAAFLLLSLVSTCSAPPIVSLICYFLFFLVTTTLWWTLAAMGVRSR